MTNEYGYHIYSYFVLITTKRLVLGTDDDDDSTASVRHN